MTRRAGCYKARPHRRKNTSVANPQLGRVVLWMTGALFSFSVSALAIRALGKHLNVFEILSIRSGFGLAVLLALVAARPALRHELALRHMGLHLAAQHHAFRRAIPVGAGGDAAAVRDRVRARIHHAGLGGAAGRAVPAASA